MKNVYYNLNCIFFYEIGIYVSLKLSFIRDGHSHMKLLNMIIEKNVEIVNHFSTQILRVDECIKFNDF